MLPGSAEQELPVDPAAIPRAASSRITPGGWCGGQAKSRAVRRLGREGGEMKWEHSLKGMNKSCGEWLKYSENHLRRWAMQHPVESEVQAELVLCRMAPCNFPLCSRATAGKFCCFAD